MRFLPSIFLLLGLVPLAHAQTPLSTTSGTGFAGAPYSAKETTTVEPPADQGDPRTTVVFVWRDAAGRTRQEYLLPGTNGGERHTVIITDPAAGVYRKWTVSDNNAQKIATIWPLKPEQHVTANIADLPPLNASSTATAYCGPGCTRQGFDLQPINGIPAVGSLTKRIAPASDSPTAENQVTSNELWISPDLRIIVRHITSNPRTGITTTNVTDLVRGDPDPELFRIPDDYRVQDRTATAVQQGARVATSDQTPGVARETATAGKVFSGAPPSANTASGNGMNGTWVNVDPGTRALKQVVIDGSMIHPFGSCQGSPCSWQVLSGMSFSDSVDSSGVTAMTAQLDTSFFQRTLTFTSEPDGRLRVDIFTHFTDNSHRSDYHSSDYFVRSQQPSQP